MGCGSADLPGTPGRCAAHPPPPTTGQARLERELAQAREGLDAAKQRMAEIASERGRALCELTQAREELRAAREAIRQREDRIVELGEERERLRGIIDDNLAESMRQCTLWKEENDRARAENTRLKAALADDADAAADLADALGELETDDDGLLPLVAYADAAFAWFRRRAGLEGDRG